MRAPCPEPGLPPTAAQRSPFPLFPQPLTICGSSFTSSLHPSVSFTLTWNARGNGIRAIRASASPYLWAETPGVRPRPASLWATPQPPTRPLMDSHAEHTPGPRAPFPSQPDRPEPARAPGTAAHPLPLNFLLFINMFKPRKAEMPSVSTTASPVSHPIPGVPSARSPARACRLSSMKCTRLRGLPCPSAPACAREAQSRSEGCGVCLGVGRGGTCDRLDQRRERQAAGNHLVWPCQAVRVC